VRATANAFNWTSIVLAAVSFATFFIGG
jgi:hypothetical protein